MSFKSDAHRKWWFANQGTGGADSSGGVAGAGGVRERVHLFRAARESGMSYADAFVMGRSAEAERAFNSQGGFASFSASADLEVSDLMPHDNSGDVGAGLVRMTEDEIAAANRERNDARIYRNEFTAEDNVSRETENFGSYEKSLALLHERLDYLNNPPVDYTSERAAEITAWAERQHSRLSEAMSGMDESSDKYNELGDLKSVSHYVIERGKLNAYNDSEFLKAGHDA